MQPLPVTNRLKHQWVSAFPKPLAGSGAWDEAIFWKVPGGVQVVTGSCGIWRGFATRSCEVAQGRGSWGKDQAHPHGAEAAALPPAAHGAFGALGHTQSSGQSWEGAQGLLSPALKSCLISGVGTCHRQSGAGPLGWAWAA